eukprot:g43697.t1
MNIDASLVSPPGPSFFVFSKEEKGLLLVTSTSKKVPKWKDGGDGSETFSSACQVCGCWELRLGLGEAYVLVWLSTTASG